MAVTAFMYARFFISALNEEVNLTGGTDDTYVGLSTSSYTPDQDTHDYQSDITNEVANGNGYTTNGVQLTSDDFTQTLNVLKWDATDPAWTSASFTARYAWYYAKLGGASTADPLISYVNFGADETVSSGTFTIVHHASGIFTVTAADAS